MPTDAKTIQIFLPNGHPQGIRIAEITTRIVQAIAFPRTRLPQVLVRPEAQQVAVYALVGPGEGHAKPIVYIGQTEDLTTRLAAHNANKDFWQVGIFVIAKGAAFNQAHIRYLEWLFIDRAKAAGRYNLDNDKTVYEPHVSEPMKADLHDTFETAAALFGTLGVPLFEEVGEAAAATEEVFRCTGPGANASGRLVEDGFVILENSLARRQHVPSAAEALAGWIPKLLKEGIVVEAGPDSVRFVENYLVNSPSSASSLALGRTSNGWSEWRDETGKTLHERKRITPALFGAKA